jgi:HD-GYP domain-containing protein (c-di-GMP phosphodiesterase class II)
MEFGEFDGTTGHLITDHDLMALSVRRGSLTPYERREIEAHVSHTREFLAVLPWPPELSRVPLIAGAHHEKLDGSGYPDGRRGDEIPLPSKVMTVCDIFDALTSMDRPYKPAVSVDTAFRILNEEAAAGLIDTDIVGVFIESGSYLKGRFSGGGAHASARHHNHAVRTPH